MDSDEAEADARALERIRRICGSFDGSDESSLQGRPMFHVRRRRFAIFNGVMSPAQRRWQGERRSLHFLSDPVERDALAHDPRFTCSPHHGDRGWFAVRLDEKTVDWQELGELLAAAYEQVRPTAQ